MEFIYFFILYNLIIGLYLISIEFNIFYTLFYMILILLINGLGLIFLGFDFIGFMFLIIYVGAIVILFLFVFIFLNYFNLKYKNTLTFPIFFFGCLLIILFLNYFSYIDIFYLPFISNIINLTIFDIGLILFADSNFVLVLFIGLFLFLILLIVIKILTIENLKRQILINY